MLFPARGVAATMANVSASTSAPATVGILVEVFMGATVVGSISATRANSKKKNRCSVPPCGVFHSACLGIDSFPMNIHEHQAKELLQKFDVATTRGRVATTLDEAEQIARELGDIDIVVKAQIHSGGRGKGRFKNGFKGGVHVRKTPDEVRDIAAKMLGQILVTHQTGPAGRLVNKVLVAESADIAREIYFAVMLDRATAAPLIVASTEGGVEIEAVAAKSPEKIIREPIDPLAGLQPYQARKLASQLGFESSQLKNASKLFDGIYRTFIAYDCSIVEVNPLVVTNKDEVLALDAKFNFDDNALYRHPEIAAMRDIAEEDPREVEASKHGLNYIW